MIEENARHPAMVSILTHMCKHTHMHMQEQVYNRHTITSESGSITKPTKQRTGQSSIHKHLPPSAYSFTHTPLLIAPIIQGDGQMGGNCIFLQTRRLKVRQETGVT